MARRACNRAQVLIGMPAPRLEFNETIHPLRRLAICAFLSEVKETEFAALRDSLQISDSSLSKHLSTLRAAGYVDIYKLARDGYTRTSITLTKAGRTAYASHISALRELTSH